MSSADVGAAEIAQLLREIRERGIEIDDSTRRRSEYPRDASNYRIRPEAVAFPKTVGDAESRTVWVDAGVVLGELCFYDEAATSGELTFAPDPPSLT